MEHHLARLAQADHDDRRHRNSKRNIINVYKDESAARGGCRRHKTLLMAAPLNPNLSVAMLIQKLQCLT
jgi:hypothetical protein